MGAARGRRHLVADGGQLLAPDGSAVAPSDLYATADNQIKLSIKTARGATVELSLASQGNGLGVEIKVSGGELTEAERKAITQLSGAFQEAIDGLGAAPPKLALSGFTGFDTALLVHRLHGKRQGRWQG